MAGRFLVQINLPVLIDNLAAADTSQDWDPEAVRAWLHEEGFIEREDGWLCDEAALAGLDRTEIISAIRV